MANLRPLLAIVVVLAVGRTRLGMSQWYVGLEIAATRYGGSAHDTTNGHVASDGRPGDATAWSIRFGRNWQRYGIALRATYANPGLTLAGQGVSVSDKTAGKLIEAATMVSTRVGGIGPSGAVRAEVGPSLHLWDFGGEIRSRVGAVGAAVYEWPFAGRFTAALRLEGMLSRSWFDAADVPPEFERRVTWRYGVSFGLRYRL